MVADPEAGDGLSGAAAGTVAAGPISSYASIRSSAAAGMLAGGPGIKEISAAVTRWRFDAASTAASVGEAASHFSPSWDPGRQKAI